MGGASAVAILASHDALAAGRGHPLAVGVFVVFAAVLSAVPLELDGTGRVDVAGVVLLAGGFSLGVGVGVYAGLCTAAVRAFRQDARPARVFLLAATVALAAGGGAALYRLFPLGGSPLALLGPALAGGGVYWLVTVGQLVVVASLAQRAPLRRVDRTQLAWSSIALLTLGPLALACTIAYAKLGIAGLVAFSVAPLILIVWLAQSARCARAATSVAEDENAELARRNRDLAELFELATALASRRLDSR